MGRFSEISSNAAYSRRIFPIMLALLVCLIWASAAYAQDEPFNSQYDPPPTNPPECGSAAPGSGCAPAAPSDTGSPIAALPTTGGFLLAPAFLGLAAVVGTGVVVVRKKR